MLSCSLAVSIIEYIIFLSQIRNEVKPVTLKLLMRIEMPLYNKVMHEHLDPSFCLKGDEVEIHTKCNN